MSVKYEIGKPQLRSSLLTNEYWAADIFCNEGDGDWLFSTVYGLTEAEATGRAQKIVRLVSGETYDHLREAVLSQCDGTFPGSTPSLQEMSGTELDNFIKAVFKELQ